MNKRERQVQEAWEKRDKLEKQKQRMLKQLDSRLESKSSVDIKLPKVDIPSLEQTAKPTRKDVSYLRSVFDLVSVICVIAGFLYAGIWGGLGMAAVVLFSRGALSLFP